MTEKQFDYLIIGNSAGGIGCVEGIRREDRKGSIAIVSDEPHHTYSRPLITHLIQGHVSRKGMDFRPRVFYTGHRVEPFLGFRAGQVYSEGRSVSLTPVEGGRKQVLKYKKLLIATGGSPFMPSVEGLDLDGVTPMITLDQSVNVNGHLDFVRNAVVLGAGLIGTKTAEALASRVEKVVLVDLADRILAPVTDPVSSRLASEVFQRNNVEIILNNTVTGISGDRKGRVSEVVLGDGTTLSCELLVVAVGVRPRVELLEGTGIRTTDPKLGGGVDVNARMETNLEGVYACGDCAHAHDFITGGMKLLPLWPNAYIGGRIAGLNMTGSDYSHRWATNMNSVDFFGLPMVSAGFMLKPGGKGFEEVVREEKGSYAKIILRDDVIQGLIMVGKIERAGIYLGLMRDKIPTSSFKSRLLSDEFSVVQLPPEVREKVRQPIREIE